MLPLLVAGAGLSALYTAGKAVDSYRYWNDYYRNTGFRPRYPWRAGVYDWVGAMGKSMTSAYRVGTAYYNYW